jgi:high-affinity K+ transport system ATPase subunit B
MGLRTVMITGDNLRTAEAVARQVGIDEVLAEVLPEDKAERVAALQARGDFVAWWAMGERCPRIGEGSCGYRHRLGHRRGKRDG